MTAQSELGKQLNKIMLETGMTPLQTISYAMEQGALNIGKHTFVAKPKEKAKS